MTKKDYILIADAIREVRARGDGRCDHAIDAVVNRIADKLQAYIPRFDRKRFLEATR